MDVAVPVWVLGSPDNLIQKIIKKQSLESPENDERLYIRAYGSTVKNLPTNVGDMASIPGSARSPGEGNGNPFQYPCLGNPMIRGAW